VSFVSARPVDTKQVDAEIDYHEPRDYGDGRTEQDIDIVVPGVGTVVLQRVGDEVINYGFSLNIEAFQALYPLESNSP
jgi:hypothetical protein